MNLLPSNLNFRLQVAILQQYNSHHSRITSFYKLFKHCNGFACPRYYYWHAPSCSICQNIILLCLWPAYLSLIFVRCILCTYAHFKSGLSNVHPTVPCFFIDEPSHHPSTCPAMSYERWEGSTVKK
jgi:hypothetical protein